MSHDAPDPIDVWWSAFAANEAEINRCFRRQSELNLADWMHEHLQPVHPELMWEFGPGLRGAAHRLVITPESRRDLRPLVWELLARAPRLPGWEFYEYRPAESLEMAEMTVDARVGGTLAGVTVALRPGEHNLVDLTYVVPVEWSDELAAKVAFVATETLVGEEALDRWIGAIEHTSQPVADFQPIGLAELREAVDRHIERVRNSLPAEPWYAVDLEAARWAAMENEPAEADDYEKQFDIFVAVTMALPVMQNALSSWLFDSVRHSQCGETFCYLKIDGVDGLDGCEFEDRGEIEDAINETIRPLALGSTIGGGTGRRYSYIELALVDVDDAWLALRARLTEARLPNRTWLMFHDSYLAAQAYGLYHDTPEPYRKPRETDE
jgi:hypothetical protein